MVLYTAQLNTNPNFIPNLKLYIDDAKHDTAFGSIEYLDNLTTQYGNELSGPASLLQTWYRLFQIYGLEVERVSTSVHPGEKEIRRCVLIDKNNSVALVHFRPVLIKNKDIVDMQPSELRKNL